MTEEALLQVICNNCGKIENVHITRQNIPAFARWIRIKREEKTFNFCSEKCYGEWKKK